jgi:hypothetical protein
VPAEKSPNFFTAADMEHFPGSAAMQAMKGHAVKTEAEYFALFRSAPGDRVLGEVSPVYLQSVFAAGRVASLIPEAKIAAILRDPVDRAFAHFIGRRRDGLDRRTEFAATIAEELANPSPKQLAFNNYLAIGKYAHFLKPFLTAFPLDRVKILFFDDFVRDPIAVLNDLFGFLGVSAVGPDFAVDRRNQGGITKNPLLRALWTGTALQRARLRSHLPKCLRDRVGRIFLGSMDHPKLADDLRPVMRAYFAEDVAELERLTGRDLSAWRDDPARPRD